VVQGVDTALFRPRQRKDFFAGRFVVFSGGKLEYRKAQDLVIHAFKEFAAKMPHARPLLLVAWENFWPQSMIGIEQVTRCLPSSMRQADRPRQTGHVRGLPGVATDGSLQIAEWLRSNDIASDQFHNLGALSQEAVRPAWHGLARA
jgi:hypothetical protein